MLLYYKVTLPDIFLLRPILKVLRRRRLVERLVANRVAEAFAEYERNRFNPEITRGADRTGGADKDGGAGAAEAGGVIAPEVRGCSYKTFLNCKPHSFNGTEGVVRMSRWFEKMESVFEISKCVEEDKNDLKGMMTVEYYPRTKIQKMEQELWTLSMKGDDIDGPANIHEAVTMARELVDHSNRRQKAAKAYVAAPAEGRGYARNLPLCNKCKLHHVGQCPPKCGRCQRDGARGRAYVMRTEEPQKNPNMVTGTLLLNDRYASILFNSGAEKSCVSTAFTTFIDIAPAVLDNSYEVELADGKVGVQFLRRVDNNDSIHVNPSNIEPVKNWKTPESPTKICSFLGLAGYYQRFFENFSKIEKPLTLLTQKNKKYEWGDKQEEAFRILKDKLWNAPVLELPDGPDDFVTKILEAQRKASKNIKAPAEMLGGLDAQFERNDDDRFTKSANFLPILKDYKMEKLARIYINKIVTRHEVLVSIISDRDSRFKSRFWQTLQKALGTRLDMRTAYHPQTDGQERDRQKSYADKRHKPLEFNVDDRVLLKLSPWKALIRFGKKGKLAPRYVGLFEIVKRVSPIAYRMRLPQESSNIHDTFHVSNFKKCLADASLQALLEEIEISDNLHFVEDPVEIVEHEVKKLKRSSISIIKFHWNSKRGAEFTWEREDQFKNKYPHLFVNASPANVTR
nr:reverse transcriptase domain-containing protein [Tanacetum cinerariifolium]